MGKLFKGCLTIIVIFIGIAILAAIFSGGDEETSEEAVTEDTTSEENSESADEAANDGGSKEAAEPAEAEEVQTYGIGDTVDLGEVQYTIHGMETADQVGPSILPETASDKYVVLDVTFKNNGSEAVTVDSSYIKLRQEDKVFEADSTASMSANQKEDGSMGDTFFLEEVNPGSERSGKVVFDIAPDIAESGNLQAEVQEGIFGTNTAVINLNK